MRRLKKLNKSNIIDIVLSKGELTNKGFDYIHPERDIGYHLEGPTGSFTFKISEQDISEEQIQLLKEDESETKLLVIKTLKEKCTEFEQLGFTWLEVERYTGKMIEGPYGPEEEMVMEKEEYLNESNADELFIDRFSYKKEGNNFIIQIDFDLLNHH